MLFRYDPHTHTHYCLFCPPSDSRFYPNALKQHEHSYRFHLDLRPHTTCTSAGARHVRRPVGQPGSLNDFSIIHVRGANGSAVSCISFYSGSACSVWELKIIGRMCKRARPRGRLTLGAYSQLPQRPSYQQGPSYRLATAAAFEIRQSEAHRDGDDDCDE